MHPHFRVLQPHPASESPSPAVLIETLTLCWIAKFQMLTPVGSGRRGGANLLRALPHPSIAFHRGARRAPMGV